MQYALSSCSYTEEYMPEHTYTFTGNWLGTNNKHSVTVKAPDLFKYNRGALIQNCFPYLSRKDREFLKTGTWLKLSNKDDEGEYNENDS